MSIFRYLSLLGLLVIAALAAPAGASATPGAIVVFDDADNGRGFRDGANTNYQDHSVTVAPGEAVTFNYPTGQGTHNVAFVIGGPTPASCSQTVGPILDPVLFPVPPLPPVTLPAPWGGSCTFSTPGVYQFYCIAHGDMIGDVTVAAATNAPPT